MPTVSVTILSFDSPVPVKRDRSTHANHFEVPREGDARVTPTHVTVLPDGTLISTWRKMYRCFREYDVDPFADGNFQQVCEWDGNRNQWKVAAGKDKMIIKKTLSTINGDGGWWVATGQAGLLYRSPDGEFREFGYRDGISIDRIDRLIVVGEDLWLAGGRSAVRVDRKKLLAGNPIGSSKSGQETGQWHEFLTRRYTYSPNGLPPLLTVNNKIVCVSNPDRFYEFPGSSVLPADEEYFLLFEDTRGRPWVVGTREEEWRVAGFVDEQWKAYPVKKRDGLTWKQSTAIWFSEKGLVEAGDFLSSDIAFGPDGRVRRNR